LYFFPYVSKKSYFMMDKKQIMCQFLIAQYPPVPKAEVSHKIIAFSRRINFVFVCNDPL